MCFANELYNKANMLVHYMVVFQFKHGGICGEKTAFSTIGQGSLQPSIDTHQLVRWWLWISFPDTIGTMRIIHWNMKEKTRIRGFSTTTYISKPHSHDSQVVSTTQAKLEELLIHVWRYYGIHSSLDDMFSTFLVWAYISNYSDHIFISARKIKHLMAEQ